MDLDEPQMAVSGGDGLSKLSDGVLGHILSFLPAKEAARAEVLSSRWRHTFAAVHTVSLVEPDGPVVDYEELGRYSPRWGPPPDPNPPLPFTNVGIQVELREPQKKENYYDGPPVHTVPRGLFSCAALRSLLIGPCLLAPPAAISLPSLETLLLAHVSDPGSDVQRLISGCPRLADLTLEACDTVTALSVAGLRRLALRCCHHLDTVAVDASELQAFEYRGAVPNNSYLVAHGGSLKTVAYCKIDICCEEVTSSSELAKLNAFLHLFAGAKHLHLESARLGSGLDNTNAFATLPVFPTLRHLELRGCLPDDNTAIFAALTRLLERAPNLEALSLVFHPEPLDDGNDARLTYYKEEIYDRHLLRYNRHSVLAVPTGGGAMVPSCLRSHVREINLVHYQGGTAQRTLAMFLLRNAPAIHELRGVLAKGPCGSRTR
ncbi:hypothetical protein E2562_033642 [Oryza meyeriana var. granulata]|uniref:F-box domain-containing protein n=1 Tax=Oryza meyeriana var. granulata TaxID=110450 RepID=A0A6G1CA65_9ORYZ|nr:hypothetical protein E2562_033642 [Oryza meyeriana var. granulata]